MCNECHLYDVHCTVLTDKFVIYITLYCTILKLFTCMHCLDIRTAEIA